MKYKISDRFIYNHTAHIRSVTIMDILTGRSSYMVKIERNDGSIEERELYERVLDYDKDLWIIAPDTQKYTVNLPQGVTVEQQRVCTHPNKRKTLMITSYFMYCPDCKQDLGNC